MNCHVYVLGSDGGRTYRKHRGAGDLVCEAALMTKPDEPFPVTTPAEYRQYAETCRVMAKCAKDAAQRQQLLTMADAWESFAIAREQSECRTGLE